MIKKKKGIYEKYVKRALDIFCSLMAIIVFSWLYIIIAIIVKIKMGSPVIFKQPRPGVINPQTRKEKIFYMYKFRTMSNEKDENGNLLSDEKRLSKFGKMLRATSLDELPEAFNILKGDMSVIGPRPQLVRDMVFMSEKQRLRHITKPGLSGLAQVKGRNSISWDEKLNWDLIYINNISFLNDLKIIIMTVIKVFGNNETSEEIDVTLDYGDELLRDGKITKKDYDSLQAKANCILDEFNQNGVKS